MGVFRTEQKIYQSNEFQGDFEIVSLVGTINTMNHEFYCHLHMSAGNEKGQVFGGHLNQAIVSATCEMVIFNLEDLRLPLGIVRHGQAQADEEGASFTGRGEGEVPGLV